MNTVVVKQISPHFISDTGMPVSEIWHKEVSFRKGSHTLITATSGAGKSSLLSYLFGERTDYSGTILYDERPITSLTRHEWTRIRQYSISFVFQGLRLFPELSALENIQLKNRLTNYKTEAEIVGLLQEAGLSNKVNEKTARLSFGQQQRVAVIRALCQPFDLLLMDEPFSHLDNRNIEIMTRIVEHELHAQQAGLVLCSLDQAYLFKYNQQLRLGN